MNKILLIACAMLTGCATAYQSGQYSLTGGYVDLKVNDKLQKVLFAANGFTGIDTAMSYAKFRCAELARKQSKPYFLMYSSLSAAAMGTRPVSRPNVGVIGAKPAAFAYVIFVDEEELGAYKTSDVLEELERKKQHDREAARNKKRT